MGNCKANDVGGESRLQKNTYDSSSSPAVVELS